MSTVQARKEETIVSEQEGRKITIIPRYCKGCEICVKLCPKAVLEIKEFKVHVARIQDCNACMLCEIRCPDFAIEVESKGKKGKS
ncbi:tungsten formylmethanofuran dehydrogenase [bacterium]|jgi:2-oxoglutarate ferredoxin oxidoreductase subunit delta|nr:tungsten formylmethanofuran dehydrogenase [bacterium]